MSKDTRVVYGAGCVWWDSIYKVAKNRAGLPCCPHCGSVLFEVPSLQEFLRGAEKYEADGHPGYKNLILWMRGKCFKDMEEAKIAYEGETQVKVTL